jgi:hypothetical protein
MMDFAIRTAADGPDQRADGVISLIPAPLRGGTIHYEGNLEVALAASYSSVRGSGSFEYDRRSKVIKLNASAPRGLALWKTEAMEATHLVIGKDCAMLGGYFGPLLKNMRTLDLRSASPQLMVAARTFTGVNFEKVLVPGLGQSPPQHVAVPGAARFWSMHSWPIQRGRVSDADWRARVSRM